MSILIYGATGYSGRLIAQRAVELGMALVLAGRNGAAVRQLATSLGVPARVFPLDSGSAIRGALDGVDTVVHAVGLFSSTSAPMLDACLASGTHYIDITGEALVFEAIAARDAEAEAAGIVMLPGAGFDVVPSDCLAAHVKRRLPGAVSLRIGIAGVGGISRGTARTMVEGLGRGTLVRRDGRIVELKDTPRAMIDFGRGRRPATGVSWGDVSTAWHSTGIPDIGVFFATPRRASAVLRVLRVVRPLLATAPTQRVLKALVQQRSEGPDADTRARGRSIIVAEAWDAAGNHVASRLETMEAYQLTAATAVDIARRVSAGTVGPGFHTPSSAFGADFILDFGANRTDMSNDK
ncbi:MAG TPA: saccharopine dehydrogenase NADP-binding domain-containing protein [Longimicrobiales bacterium]|nr:saccharopine dehydrogenase NADP-binding domain-containing protein [Longimicrobiales bacterium]